MLFQWCNVPPGHSAVKFELPSLVCLISFFTYCIFLVILLRTHNWVKNSIIGVLKQKINIFSVEYIKQLYTYLWYSRLQVPRIIWAATTIVCGTYSRAVFIWEWKLMEWVLYLSNIDFLFENTPNWFFYSFRCSQYYDEKNTIKM